MFKLYAKHAHSFMAFAIEASSHESEFSVLPILELKFAPEVGTRFNITIQRADRGLPGYYVTRQFQNPVNEVPDEVRIITAYLADKGDRIGFNEINEMSDSSLRRTIKSYVYLAIQNMFITLGLPQRVNGYSTRDQLPDELRAAIEKFVDLEMADIRRRA